MPRKAAIYARISSDRDGLSLGVERQLADCRELAARKGWPIAEEYIDNDISAYSGKPRPEYQRMLEDIKAGDRDAVVVYNADRLHRQPKELEEFMELCDAVGLKDMATCSGDTDLATDDGRLIARIMGAVARKESDDKSRRIRRKHAELAQRGMVAGGGNRPYGYAEDKITLVPSEAAVIQEAAKRVLSGDSLRSLCIEFQSRGLPTATGGQWRAGMLRRILSSARIAGQREHHGEVAAQAVWPAIITPQQSSRLRAFFADPERKGNRPPRRYLLAGFLRCALCNAKLVSRPRADGTRNYVCAKAPGFAGCGRLAILAETLEAFVVDAVMFRLDSPELAQALAGRQRHSADEDAAHDDLNQANGRLDELAKAYAAKEISLREWLVARKPIEREVEAAKKRLSRFTHTPALTGFIGNAATLRVQWSDLTLTRQQVIVRAILDHVRVGPAVRGRNRFDPSRLTPVWRI